MSDPIALRVAGPADAEPISALIRSLAPYFLADPEHPEAAAPFFQTITAAAIADAIRGGRHVYHLAEAADRLAGVVAIRDDSHLYHLFVAEAFQRRGLATRLWEHARDAARARGGGDRFTVNSSIHGLPLYRGLGFRETGERMEKDGIAWVPMVLEDGVGA